ncbi:MAG: SDR family NAD(P)-dependent oxidoreductase [Bacteroidetes bacterium]|nr:SDR family NAD(P)-dependent oxidoreductase [Bacteroidota bacterium]
MKQILLTGSATGFGLLTLKTLASQGHTVYATMRNVNTANAKNAAEIREWATKHNAHVHVVELDVTSESSVTSAIKTILKTSNNRLDVLINNAGVSFYGVSESLSTEQTNQLFQVNTIGADRLIRAVLPTMRAQKDGLIINISSVLSRNQVPTFTIYNATKAATDALTIGYHYELRSLGIDVIGLQPAAFNTTDIVSKQLQPANPTVANEYGEDVKKVKAAMDHLFTPSDQSQNPQLVADQILALINAQKGSRALFTQVGDIATAPYIEQVNQTTKAIVDAVVNSIVGA